MDSIKNFSFDTIENFDEHIDKSIPNYKLLQEAIVSLSEFVVQPNTAIVDLGCSTGKLLNAIPHNGEKIGIDISSNLLPKSDKNIKFIKKDIRDVVWALMPNISLVMSIFTLQFVPKEDRLKIVEMIFHSLEEGGAFIWAEKVVCKSGWQQELMTFSHYDYKKNFFTNQEIMDKEHDLRQIMKCNTSKENESIAKLAGFEESQLIWKFFNFECWVFIKS